MNEKLSNFIEKLSKYNYEETSISNDYSYYVHINMIGKRVHLSQKEKTIEKISNNLIVSTDKYKVYTIDVGINPSELRRLRINSFWKILIIIKLDPNDNINDFSIHFPYLENEDFVKRFMDDLFPKK